MYKKIYISIRNIRIFESKQYRNHHLIIIDGPSAISISKLLADNDKTFELRFIASSHYLAQLNDATRSLKKRMVGWQLSTLLSAMLNYLIALLNVSGRQSNNMKLPSVFNRTCIADYISKNAQQINSVIVFNERNFPPAFAIATAKKMAIKTACIQHGAVVENYFPIQVDCYYTWSEYYSQLLLKRTPGLKTISVGRPNYKTPEFSGISSINKPLLVLQPANVSINEKDLLSHFQRVIDVCFQFFDEITLRPHPSDNILAEITSYIGDRSFTIDSGAIGVALANHKFTLSLYSTVLYEAPLYGSVPVQYLEPHLEGELMDRCELLAGSPKQLNRIFNKLTEKSHYDECLDRARKYSAERMTICSTDVLFQALTQQY